MDYQKALEWIHGLYRFGSNLGLERVNRLMELLGNPQHQFQSIHIAGTNGKGSTASFLAEMLQAEGFKVGLYTSPYIEKFTNRMAINGIDISEEEIVRIVEKVKPAVEELAAGEVGQPTEFEVVTALAFTYFALKKPDWGIVEVGLGGRLDATNVVQPRLSVITNIGLEHTQVLGETIAAIAAEKAGIIKRGVPVVTAAEKEEALRVFQDVVAQKETKLWQVDRDFTYEIRQAGLDGIIFDYQSPWRKITGLEIKLIGRHQARNAALAVAARELMPLTFNEESVRTGLVRTRWPGRLEVFSREPLVMVDGAHNVDGILALRAALKEILVGRRLQLVLGILGDKAVDEILSLIIPVADAGIIITAPDNPRAANPYEVAELAKRYAGKTPVDVIPSVDDAVRRAVDGLPTGEALCVSGSLYTISEAREVLKELLQA
ncbi:MAG: bifunctional folylpolyglutamate synthase/dihydrofolate synthase [Firmicutes bacterium]|nr:bifunctional folylpolyglutamate synthase/dihydrofolate synthase [Bacillota bacterium]